MNESGESQSLIERLAEEFLERWRRGEEPSVDEYMDRHPELADDLHKVLRAILVMERLRSSEETPSGPIFPSIGRDRRAIPDRLGDFRIVRFLAEGGMGYVFEAEQESMGRHVALKILKPEMHSRTILARFLRESKAAGRLHHTNIIPIFGIGECDGLHYYAMQYIHGESLARVIGDLRQVQAVKGVNGVSPDPGDGQHRWPTLAAISRMVWEGSFGDTAPLEADGRDEAGPASSGPVEVHSGAHGDGTAETPNRDSADATRSLSESGLVLPAGGTFYKSVARIGEQAARALGSAHRHGVLHRDIKPANLLLDLQGNVWVADFGLAYEMEADDLSRGDVVGTLRFIPPERFRQESLPQGDVYSLGLTLYELVTLQPAFRARHPRQLMHAVEHDQPRPPRTINGKVPRDLETIILKASDKDPARRYATADEMADDLLAFREDREIRGRRARWDERLIRWCRRSPYVAALTATVLLLLSAIAVGMSLAVVWLRTERRATQHQLGLTREAEAAGRRRLLDSLRAQAQAGRRGIEAGRRYRSLNAISQAARLMRELGLESEKELVLRNEAVACLALVDLLPIRTLPTLADQTSIGGELSDVYLPFDAEFRRCVRLTDDGQLAVIGTSDGQVVERLDAPRGVFAGGFSPDGRHFAANASHPDEGRVFAVWDLGQARPAPTILLRRPVASWAFHPDGHRLAIGNLGDGTTTWLDLSSGRESVFTGSGAAPTEHDQAMAFSPDGNRLAIGTDKGESVRMYDVGRGTVVDDWTVGSTVFCVAWSDDGRLLAAGCDDHRIYVRDTAPEHGTGPAVVSALVGHKNSVIRLAFVGDLLVSDSHDETVRVWNPVTGTELTWCAGQYVHRGPGQTVLVEAPSLTLRHETMAVVTGEFHQVRQGIFGNRMRKPWSVTSTVSFHPNGNWLATSNSDGVRLYDTHTFAESARLLDAELGSSSVAFHPSGRELMTFGAAGVRLRAVSEEPDAAGGLRIGPARTVASTHSEGPCKTPYSADGRSLGFAVPSEGWAGIIRDGNAERMVRLGPHARVRHITLSPDGRFAATSTWKGSGVKVWDAAHGVLVQEIPSASARCEFSPDGRWLATSAQGSSRLWHVGSWRPGPLVHGEDSDANGPMAFSPDGTVLAVSVDFSRRIKLVRLDTAGELATLEPPDQPTLHDMAFSSDGALLAAATSDHTTEVWDLRGVRRELRRIGLDWDLPAHAEPPIGSGDPSRSRRVTISD